MLKENGGNRFAEKHRGKITNDSTSGNPWCFLFFFVLDVLIWKFHALCLGIAMPMQCLLYAMIFIHSSTLSVLASMIVSIPIDVSSGTPSSSLTLLLTKGMLLWFFPFSFLASYGWCGWHLWAHFQCAFHDSHSILLATSTNFSFSFMNSSSLWFSKPEQQWLYLRCKQKACAQVKLKCVLPSTCSTHESRHHRQRRAHRVPNDLPCLQTCSSRKAWASAIRFKTWVESMRADKVKARLTFNAFDLWVEMSSPTCHTTRLMKLLVWLSAQELQRFQVQNKTRNLT